MLSFERFNRRAVLLAGWWKRCPLAASNESEPVEA
jgi:hypothetical protein